MDRNSCVAPVLNVFRSPPIFLRHMNRESCCSRAWVRTHFFFLDVYNFSRYAVLPGHEHKACTCTQPACSWTDQTNFSAIVIPYNNIPYSSLSDIHSCSSHVRVQATITSIENHRIILSPNPQEFQQSSLDFDYAIYALGSHLPSPIDLWNYQKEGGMKSSLEPPGIPKYGGTKSEGVTSLRERQKRVEAATSVLVVGGGALGIRKLRHYTTKDAFDGYIYIEFASDIAAVYPQKRVTLLHSRHRLLPKFDDTVHEEGESCVLDIE